MPQIDRTWKWAFVRKTAYGNIKNVKNMKDLHLVFQRLSQGRARRSRSGRNRGLQVVVDQLRHVKESYHHPLGHEGVGRYQSGGDG